MQLVCGAGEFGRALKVNLAIEQRGDPDYGARADPLLRLSLLGCSQVVRQRILIPPCEGSNPSIPANVFSHLATLTRTERGYCGSFAGTAVKRPTQDYQFWPCPILIANAIRCVQQSRKLCRRVVRSYPPGAVAQ